MKIHNYKMDNIVQAQDKFSLLDLAPLGVCVLQSDYTVLFWNCCLEEWTKIPRTKILGTSISQYFSHFNLPQYTNRLQEIFQGGPPTIFSSQLHKQIIPASRQGRYCIQHTTVTSVPAFDGDDFYAMLSIQDVTDLTFRVEEYKKMRDRALAETVESQRAREAAEAANRIKDEFLAIVSHELRTPLNPILGWSKLLKKHQLDAAKIEIAIDTIERNAQLQAQLIDDLLDVSRILQGKLELKIETVDLTSIVKAALATLELATQAKFFQMKLQLDATAFVRGDANRLQQIVLNLLSNAIKFTPSGGQIEVCLQQIDGQAQLRVRDNGKGIGSNFLPHIFEYFRQGDSSTTRNFGGLGLGLAIAHHLTELHGGTIVAESPGEEQGATFTVRIPILTHIVQQPQPAFSSASSILQGVKILLVEDELDSRELIAFILQEEGAIVVAVGRAMEALQTIALGVPDILVSDIGMPEMDGYDLIEKIRTLPREQGGIIPALALTAYAGKFDHEQALAAGFQIHLTKPIEARELIAAIANLTAQSKSHML